MSVKTLLLVEQASCLSSSKQAGRLPHNKSFCIIEMLPKNVISLWQVEACP